jgi:hypothetical protein
MQKAAVGFLESLDNNPFRGPAEEGAPPVIEEDPIGNLAQTSQELDQKVSLGSVFSTRIVLIHAWQFDERITEILVEHDAANNLDVSILSWFIRLSNDLI